MQPSMDSLAPLRLPTLSRVANPIMANMCPYCGRVDGHTWTCRKVAGHLSVFIVAGLFTLLFGVALQGSGRTSISFPGFALIFLVIAVWLCVIYIRNRS